MQLEAMEEYPRLENGYRDKSANNTIEFQLKKQRTINHVLIDAIRDSMEVSLGAAATSGEADKILKSVEILSNALATVAKG